MKVRKAVIPAGGWGTRLLPATKALPKEMLPIVDKPAIQYVVEEAAASGIRDILFVLNRGKGAIMDHFDRNPALEQELAARDRRDILSAVQQTTRLANCFFVRQPELRGLGDALRHARNFVGDEYFAVLLPDDLIEAPVPCLQQLLHVHNATGGSVIAVQPVERSRVGSYGIVRPGPSPTPGVVRVEGLVEKPRPDAAPSTLAVVGRYVLTGRIFHHLANLLPGHGGEFQLTDALQTLLSEETIHACRFEGIRFDVGNPLGLVQANLYLALGRAQLRPALQAFMQRLLTTEEAGRKLGT